MSLRVDTNVLCELRKGTRANARVRAWFSGVSAEEIYLSVLVVGELRRGIERVRSKPRRTPARPLRWSVG